MAPFMELGCQALRGLEMEEGLVQDALDEKTMTDPLMICPCGKEPVHTKGYHDAMVRGDVEGWTARGHEKKNLESDK